MTRNPLGMALSSAVQGLDPGFAPQAPQAPQGLSKGELILGVLADALSGAAGRPGAFAAQQGQLRQEERQMAQWGLKRRADLQDYAEQQKIAAQYRTPAQPHRWEDNAGNQWEMDLQTGQPRRFFTDTAPKQFIQDGMLVKVPNPFAPAAPGAAPAITEDLWNKGVPMGGAAPKATSPFPRRSPLPAS